MASTTVTLKYRPVRIGLLVRPNDLADLERAASLSTLLWGGINNPIIPVSSENDEFANQLLKLFQVDVVHAVSHTKEIDDFIQKHPFLQAPGMHSRELLHEDWQTKKLRVGYLDTLNAIQKYWQKEFKNAPPEHSSPCSLIEWKDDDVLKEVFALSYGMYPSDQNLEGDFYGGFLKGLRAEITPIAKDATVPSNLIDRITPLQLTRIDLKAYHSGFRSWDGIYFGEPKNFDDLLSFWNLRAAGNNLIFASLPELDRMRDLVNAQLKFLDELPDRHPNMRDHIHFSFGERYREQRDAATVITDQFTITKSKAINFCDNIIWNGLNVKPFDFCFSWDQIPAFVEQSKGNDYNVTIALPEKKFLIESEDDVNQCMAISVSPLGDYAYPEYSLTPPYQPELNEFYSRQISADPWKIRSELEGVGVLITTSTRAIDLRPIHNIAIVKALLGLKNMKIEPSQSGRLTDRLSERVEGLEGSRVFKIRGVRNLIANLNPMTPVTKGVATGTIWNNGQFKEHEMLYIEQRDMQKLTTEATFDFLLKNDFFRVGLELDCDHCGLKNWLSLRQIDDLWTCEFCGHKNMTSLHVKNRGDWKFRKSGLLAKDNNQEGAIPVLLSLLTLSRCVGHFENMKMTSVNFTDGVAPCEMDFIFISYGRRSRGEEVEWGLGEAKSEGGEVDENDIKNMKQIAEKLKCEGIVPYFIFSKTADAFNLQEIELFKKLHEEKYSVIMLTNKELEPYHPYNDAIGTVPRPYANSLQDMAINTWNRYLQSEKAESPANSESPESAPTSVETASKR